MDMKDDKGVKQMTNEEMETIRKEGEEAVKGPGKFEGEQRYSPYFYDAIMDGGIGEDFYFGEGKPEYTLYILEKEDKDIFPELENVYGVCLWESEQGFFNCIPLDSKEDYDSEYANLSEQQEAESEG
jgi:hypothetical protein